MDLTSQDKMYLEGQPVKLDDGAELTVISVSTAVSETARHIGIVALEGRAGDYSEDRSSVTLSCVSQVY